MKQAVHSLETGSLEVKRVLLNEANLIYECKVCLGMFRSIANLGNLKENIQNFKVLHFFIDVLSKIIFVKSFLAFLKIMK